MNQEPEPSGDEPTSRMPWPPPPPGRDLTPTVPLSEPDALDPTLPQYPRRSIEAVAEAGWQRIRRGLLVAAVAFALAIGALLTLGALVAGFDDDRSFVGTAVHVAARLWFVGVLYIAVAVPVAHVALRARRGAARAVSELVSGLRRYWRWLVGVGIGAPLVSFAVLEPGAALLVVALLVAAIIVLNVLGVSF